MVFRMRFLWIAMLSTAAIACLASAAHAQTEKSEEQQEAQTSEEMAAAEAGDQAQAGEPEAERRGRGQRGAGERGAGAAGSRGGGQRGSGQRGPGGPTGQRRGPQAETESTQASGAQAKKATPALSQDLADKFNWRSIGPANMSGRITAIAVSEKDHCTWWAATASGGLLKTTNNGITLEHQFEDQSTVSIGDVQVSQSNPDIVWVGTGESNPRNSVSWGDGVYKSEDGGKTWKNMGLDKTFQTGALAIHPENPDVVWVGSLGRLWGPNPERGLFKTTDGGETWKKVLFVNDVTGVIDVQVNPGNPDEMLVATYERKRDGFDGNDPEQRFGAGAGIYKSTDGGESFQRITEGLPSCKMGRIGIDYFESDPNVVVAIIESEKIAKEPEGYAFAGLRGEDADVGARMVNITKDGPSEKAGLKVGDIVVSVDGRVVPSYSEMMVEMHKRLAGETVKVVVSRDRKLVDIDLTLGKQPESNSSSTSRNSSSRSDFTGTLGGQAPNLQDTQGPEGHEFGGVYLSEDGGTSWKRINSLNPRPMYYSNIQIDPLDRNNIYVCGTSLYRSSDGGKTFTGDGGSDGIHVDHHALWIDNKDPRHMILGNDGGIHVTYDRMEHWDHYNHVAIGQFYHVDVDSNLDYKVYGGLQDNGSWGGPSRGRSGSGPVNTDWFNVGGGDGFVTRVDPNDANQIYFESQNGGMGRIHLETGERGFIRPSERGMRFRFNWKTPYILSPHNSKVHYSAGSHVFRSFDRGNNTKRISPEITNSDKGAGSALTESPMEPGLIYVGTTDGAVWITKDGGYRWDPLFYNPVAKEEEKPEEKPEGEQAQPESEQAAESEKNKPTVEKPTADPVSGAWDGMLISERVPEDRAKFSFKLKLDGDKVSGEVDGRDGPTEISEGSFNPQTGAVSFTVESDRGSRVYTGVIKDEKLTGDMSAGGGRFEVPFEAKKKKDPARFQLNRSGDWLLLDAAKGLSFTVSFSGSPLATGDDPVSGEWACLIENENLPDGRLEFSLELEMDDKGKISGIVASPMGDSEITAGVFNAETKRILISASSQQFELEFAGTIAGSEINGDLDVNGGEMELEFSGKRTMTSESRTKTGEKTDSQATAVQPTGDKPAEGKLAADPSQNVDPPKAATQETAPAVADDGVSGTWTGQMTSPRGEQEVTVVVKRKSDKEITGTFETTRGERNITSGTFDPESKRLTMVAEDDQMSLELKGSITGNTYAGEIDFDGRFTMEFSLERTAKGQKTSESADQADSKPAETPKAPTGEKTLSGLMPGPRWVSSLEASRFKKERCYITFDGHRSDDDGVYVFVTNDYGQTWESLTGSLPTTAGSARVIREDIVNQNLLFLGCEFSSWYSIDGGKSWTRIKGGLPTVAVHDFAIHPKAGEVVAATHGRSLWIADVSVLRQLTPESLQEDSFLYKSKDAIRWRQEPSRGSSGTRKFVGANPPNGTHVAYSLGKNARQVKLEILDLEGDTVKTFEAPTTKGLHLLNWDLRSDSAGGGRFRQSLATGDYMIRLKVDGKTHQSKVSVKPDPGISAAAAAELERQLLSVEMQNLDEGDE